MVIKALAATGNPAFENTDINTGSDFCGQMGFSVRSQMLELRVALHTSLHAAFVCKILGGGFGWLERRLVDGDVVAMRKLTMISKCCWREVCKRAA